MKYIFFSDAREKKEVEYIETTCIRIQDNITPIIEDKTPRNINKTRILIEESPKNKNNNNLEENGPIKVKHLDSFNLKGERTLSRLPRRQRAIITKGFSQHNF